VGKAKHRMTDQQLVELVGRGVNIWKQEDGVLTQNDALRDHFCSVCLPLASNSQFAEAGVKEAKIVSATGRNEELRSVCAISRSFLFERLKLTKNTPGRVVQNLSLEIEQNEIHEKEITKPERKERRKQVMSALPEDHFRNAWPEKKQQKIFAKGSEDKGAAAMAFQSPILELMLLVLLQVPSNSLIHQTSQNCFLPWKRQKNPVPIRGL
jgi:hypothetical protein